MENEPGTSRAGACGWNRSRVVWAAAAVVAVLAACTPPSPTPGVPAPTGGSASVEGSAPVGGSAPAAGAPQAVSGQSSRDVVTRSVDGPPRLDCVNWRYGPADPAALPQDFDEDNYRHVSSRAPRLAGSQQHLCGQRGGALDLAWGVTQGRPDVVTAVLDSGIIWTGGSEAEELSEQAWLNTAELTPPAGGVLDSNSDGVVTASDFNNDPRVGDRNDNGYTDPEDLILSPAFNDGVDSDANGYVDDISGWDFLFNDNNPNDDVKYGHGTGMARSAAARDGGDSAIGHCPRCRVLHVRVADSFIAEGGRFAAGTLFALDSGASLVQESLGAISNASQAQQAVDLAYSVGVPIIASMADESSKHPNLPAALEHTIPANSITSELGPLADIARQIGSEGDNLSLNGCTNYGGTTFIAVPSDSCSSEATANLGGIAGLILSAARDAEITAHPSLSNTASKNPISANELKQLLRATADDIDFSSPGTPGVDAPNGPGNPLLERYPTRPGWDAVFGFGRVNIYEAVRATRDGEIPPEADLAEPSINEVLPATGVVPIRGSVAAVRSESYSWAVQWAVGLQPPAYPAVEQWRTAASGDNETAPRSGVLGELNLAEIAAALPNGGVGPSSTNGVPDEDRFAVRLRIVVTDAQGRHGVAQKQVYVHDDPTMAVNLQVPGAGTSSPAFGDLDGDGGEELILATDDGVMHAFKADGSELAGWPVTNALATWWHAESPHAKQSKIAPIRDGFGVGAPVVTDLDGDGSLEVAATDLGGHLTVWSADGRRRARFATEERFGRQSASTAENRTKVGILAMPAAGDLDGDGVKELIAAAYDRHVYAWDLDGTTQPGFPVLVVDPARAEQVDPVTHKVRFNGGANGADAGGELIVTPTVADLTGDGRAEIVVGAQEQYRDEPSPVFLPIAIPGLSGTTRLYALWNDGTNHPETSQTSASIHPDDQAYLPGWPTRLPMVVAGVLPLIGNGVNTQAVVGELDGDPAPEIAASSAAGPVMVFDVDGRSPWGREFGVQLAPDWLGEPFGPRASSRDGGILVSAFGGPSLGDLTGDGRVDLVSPTVGLTQALDQLLPGRQRGNTQMMAWDLTTRRPLVGFPRQTRDLGFFVTPAIADVDGDGDAEAVAGHGVALVEASDAEGNDASGFPKLTGGWTVGTPAFGDRDGDGRMEMAITRRDGWLQVWELNSSSTVTAGWPRFGHDGSNSGDSRVVAAKR